MKKLTLVKEYSFHNAGYVYRLYNDGILVGTYYDEQFGKLAFEQLKRNIQRLEEKEVILEYEVPDGVGESGGGTSPSEGGKVKRGWLYRIFS